MDDLILIIIFSLLLVEVIFQLSWFKLYFKNGVPIFIKKYPFFGSLREPFDIEYLEEQFRSGSTCTIYFRRFNEFECGFREKLWEIKLFNYIPVMRGVIRSEENSQLLYVIGYLNWYVFFILTYVLISIVADSGQTWLPFIILASAIYVVQFQRYGRIADVAFEWLKKNR